MIFSAIHAFGFEFSQAENRPCRQDQQLPHEIGNGTTTRSPTARFVTPGPTSMTSPMNSWPRTSPFCIVGMKPLYRCRSEPQMAVEVMRTTASRAFRIWGSGTSRTSTFVLPIHTFARIVRSPFRGRLGRRARRDRDGARAVGREAVV